MSASLLLLKFLFLSWSEGHWMHCFCSIRRGRLSCGEFLRRRLRAPIDRRWSSAYIVANGDALWNMESQWKTGSFLSHDIFKSLRPWKRISVNPAIVIFLRQKKEKREAKKRSPRRIRDDLKGLHRGLYVNYCFSIRDCRAQRSTNLRTYYLLLQLCSFAMPFRSLWGRREKMFFF